ncbi:PepSY-associated TM helix domain-containing protein [Rheinheimera sp.]|uniref:PepSY-associated TM helix domain-containing protein n=1 Tax=Rheinheimera sp. TaxID=1869214 RepID=UPI00307D0835
MKVSTQKSFRAVHTWTGLVAGLFLFIAFYAGSVSVFVHELMSWQQQGELRQATSLDRAQPLIDQFLAQTPEAAHGFSLVLPGHHGPELSLYWYNEQSGAQQKIQWQGDELSHAPARQDFVSLIYDLHFTAGLPRLFGTYLFGIVCILYGLALVSGVVIYAPVFFKDLFALRFGQSLKRVWQDAHNLIGVLSLPFHILFAWSGAVLTIGFVLLAPFQFLVYDGKLLEILEPEFEVVAHVEPTGVKVPLLPVTELLAKAQATLPELEIESLYYHDAGDQNGNVTFYGQIHSQALTQSGVVVLNASTAEVLGQLTPEQFRPGTTFLRGLQSLHYGNFAEYPVKWLYFLLGLAGAFLFYSGNLMWIEARRKAGDVLQPRSIRFLTALTNGSCIGAMAGVSGLFLAGTLLPEALHAKVYFALFGLALLWAFIRPAVQARRELLLLTALLTLLIPLAGYLHSGEQLLSALLQGHWIRFGVDATALGMAAAFWRLSRI